MSNYKYKNYKIAIGTEERYDYFRLEKLEEGGNIELSESNI